MGQDFALVDKENEEAIFGYKARWIGRLFGNDDITEADIIAAGADPSWPSTRLVMEWMRRPHRGKVSASGEGLWDPNPWEHYRKLEDMFDYLLDDPTESA